jgi:hypothetical protein
LDVNSVNKFVDRRYVWLRVTVFNRSILANILKINKLSQSLNADIKMSNTSNLDAEKRQDVQPVLTNPLTLIDSSLIYAHLVGILARLMPLASGIC